MMPALTQRFILRRSRPKSAAISAMSMGYDMITEPPETEADVFAYLRERELCQTVYT
jgi:hypothetical protein